MGYVQDTSPQVGACLTLGVGDAEMVAVAVAAVAVSGVGADAFETHGATLSSIGF